MTYHKEGPACGKIPCDPTSSEARPWQQSSQGWIANIRFDPDKICLKYVWKKGKMDKDVENQVKQEKNAMEPIIRVEHLCKTFDVRD